MNVLGSYIVKKSAWLLEKKQRAVLCAALFSLLPFGTWLSVALIALVILRKGPRTGFDTMLPALVVHSVPLMMLLPWPDAFFNSLMTYLPAFIAATTLRIRGSWSLVFSVFFMQAAFALLMLECFVPELIISQMHFILSQYKESFAVLQPLIRAVDFAQLAYLFLGMQLLALALSSCGALMCARAVQARLFMPGGFKRELANFRGSYVALLLFVLVFLAMQFGLKSAAALFPLLFTYFLFLGFRAFLRLISGRFQKQFVILLFVLLVVQPLFFLLAYALCGVLDSLFHFMQPKTGE